MNGKIILCEYARVANNGSQFDALGAGINNLQVPVFPAPIAVAVLVETKYTAAETGKDYPFEIKIIDSEGKAAAPTLGGNIRVVPNHKGAVYAAFNIQFFMKNQISLSFSLLLNGEEKDCVCLEIKKGTSIDPPRNMISTN